MSKPEIPSKRILVVEDEPIVADFIRITLTGNQYQTSNAIDGESAWNMLNSGNRFEAILLDRGLPDMDGLVLLRRMKEHPTLQKIPVIIQTGYVDLKSVSEGLAAGAYYYLTKPLQTNLMLAVIYAAIAQRVESDAMQTGVQQAGRLFEFLDVGEFSFQTLKQAHELAQRFARICPNPDRAVLGLMELLVNAVEHGNLALSYADKSRLMLDDRWDEEIERRAVNPLYRDRRVTVRLTKTQEEMHFLIQDEGLGFEWDQYLEISPERLFDPHGRGIAMARITSFDSIEYQGNGNTVKATISLPKLSMDKTTY